jgi:phosphatidylinositol alpha-1,6-mannosyltransferase
VVVHGSEITRHARTAITATLMRRILGRSKMVLANSRFTLQIASAHFSRHERGCVLNPCLGIAASHAEVRDPADLNARWDLGGRRVLFTASRLTRRKGHAEVIRALGLLRAEFPTLCYVFTGSGNYVTELRQLAREVGCDDLLRPVGRVDLDTLHRLYQRCDLYVSPGAADDYDYEGFGIAFMEAAYHGKVVVAGRDGGEGDAVLDGKTGLLVNPTAIPELADAIRRLLLNPSLRETMGERARRRAIEDFSIPAMTKRLHEIGLSAVPSNAVERSAT